MSERAVVAESGLFAAEGHAGDGGDEKGFTIEIPHRENETKVAGAPTFEQAKVSAVSFSPAPPSIAPSRLSKGTTGTATGTVETMPGRKVHRDDVKKIFMASTTTGTVQMQQLRRIKLMHTKISDAVNVSAGDFTVTFHNSMACCSICLHTHLNPPTYFFSLWLLSAYRSSTSIITPC